MTKKRHDRSGTSRSQGEMWLRENRPDLLEKVERGALTIHGAMVEAGARPKMVTIPIEINLYRQLEFKAVSRGQSVAQYCRSKIFEGDAHAGD